MLFGSMQKSFLQSAQWGTFQASVGGNAKIVAHCQVLEYSSPVGSFWYVPHYAEVDLELLMTEAQKQGIIFIRCEPQVPTVLPAGARVVNNRQPHHTLILDITQPAEALLTAMHPKTRYNIRLAEKKNLTISWEKNPAVFISLMNETSSRDKFGAHSTEYYQNMIANPLIEQGTIYLAEQPIASAIFIEYEQTYTYLHGASSNEHREVMAPYLLQWSAITRAQKKGCTVYDFWGIAPPDVTSHPLSGVTRFKLGFGGQVVAFGQAFEIPIKTVQYKIFNFLKKLRV